MDVTGNTEKSTPLNPEVFEERLRKIRLTGMVLAAAAAASLAVAMVMDPVPPLFPVLAAALGTVYGLFISLSRKSIPSLLVGFLSGMTVLFFMHFRFSYFPEMGEDLFSGLWHGLSAMMIGTGTVAIPLARHNLEIKRPEIQADMAAIARFRERGDSAFVAQARLDAQKNGKAHMIAVIVLAAAMAGLGLYVWLHEDDRLGFIGLLFAAMTALSIAYFAWMLKLKRST